MHIARHKHDLENKRAAAGGIVIHSPTAQPPPALPTVSIPATESPLQILGNLKAMLDAGLIETNEYQAKKARRGKTILLAGE